MIAFSWHEKRTLTPKQRFEASILKDENDCWVWQGKIKRNLPVICIEQNYINAKLYSFIENVGEIFESNYTVVNNCGNKLCVNPQHLNLENRVLQAFKKSKEYFDSLTNCKKCGFKKEGFIADGKGSLCCPECIKNRQKKRYAITSAVFICDCCGIKKLAHLDHIQPIFLGGANFIKNLQYLCQPCNLSKNKKHPLSWARENGRLL